MNSIHYLRDEIAVVGWACRLPGANSPTELWSMLLEGRCAVSSVPPDRFSLERFGHPRRQERGKSYTWAAGIIDDLWGFDPSVFGISPREAEQMDPQQRILLQLTWEALEDAGIRPSSITGADVGVYVGASQTDYGHSFFNDQASADSHFATGTALAVLANRISHIYDLRGPSITVDTACSSSLVALHEAVEALRSGRVDTAIVGGINVIASPASFIAFSQASMLSPTGLSRAFSADADGFVRGEGGTVLVLRKASHAQTSKNPIHGLVLATDVNSDGRTNGISLPSLGAQEALLQRVYSRASLSPDRLAFVEAHGTGTPAGDPIEATALGRSIGRARSSPLPIGSIKTNIGHLEPASGLAGLLKACMALNHGILPPSLHFTQVNPNIDLEKLNLTICNKPLLLPNAAQQLAGVSSFGFGGTNAHVVIAAGKKVAAPAASLPTEAGLFAFSADSKPALVELAEQYKERVANLSDQDTATLAGAIIHRRDHLSNRIVVSSSRSQDVSRALTSYMAGEESNLFATGTAAGDNIPVTFVYSGNGSQWIGMGRSAYRHNARFRTRFDQVDRHFKELAGWSLAEALFNDSLQLPLTSIAQPLIFAIQSAATAALRARGLRPSVVMGHSVGEVAAAEAAGILSLRTAVEVIYSRSTHQELTHGAGRMAAVLASADVVEQMAELVEGIEIAAINSPRAVTVAGPTAAVAAFMELAETRGIAALDLDLDYPFHTIAMTPIGPQLAADLKNIKPGEGDIPFVSTVTGACLPGSRLDAGYWWSNVRETVQFADAVRTAAALGSRYFVEIGPRRTLLKHINDILADEATPSTTISVLDRNDLDADPFDKAIAMSLVNGAQLDLDAAFGGDPGAGISLPLYPWQQQPFRLARTSEAIGVDFGRHPFSGARHTENALTWYSHIDSTLYSYLVDHKLGEQVIFPGTGFLEIAFTVARQWLRAENVIIAGFEILKPLDLTNGESREVMTRVSPGSNTIEIFSRPRLSHVAWLLHCRGKMVHGSSDKSAYLPTIPAAGQPVGSDVIYHVADACGLHYGPAFRLAQKVTLHNGTLLNPGNLISVDLTPPSAPTPFALDPMRLDACTHGVFAVFPELHAEERGVAYIPVRLDEAILYSPGAVPARAFVEILKKSERAIVANHYVYGADGEIIAVLRGVRCQAVTVRRTGSLDTIALVERPQLIDGTIAGNTGVAATARDIVRKAGPLLRPSETGSANEGPMLVEGWATAAAYEIASALADDVTIDVDMLIASGRLPDEMRSWFVRILVNLEGAGLAKQDSGLWTLTRDSSLPTSASLVQALANEYPTLAADLLLAGAITEFAQRVTSDRTIANVPESILTNAVLDFYDGTTRALPDASNVLSRLIFDIEAFRPKDRALRVLQVGFGPLTDSFASLKQDNFIRLTVFEPDARRHERAGLSLSNGSEFTLLGAEDADKLAFYDLIISAGGLHRLPSDLGLGELKNLLVPNGLLIAIEPRQSLFKDLVFGLDSNWFAKGLFDYPVGLLRSVNQWDLDLERAGFVNSEAHPIYSGADLVSLIVAEGGPAQAPAKDGAKDTAQVIEPKTVVVAAPSGQSALASKLGGLPRSTGLAVSMLAELSDFPSSAPEHVVLVPSRHDAYRDPVEALTKRCLEIKSCAEKIGAAQTTLWVVFFGAVRSGPATVRPIEAGAWAFSRTLANEYPKIDVRRVDFAPHVTADVAAEAIRKIILSGTEETDIHADGAAFRAIRVEPLKRAIDARPGQMVEAARLERRLSTGQRLAWKPMVRRRPNASEVEIVVEATGLNFRDLMWTLSILPDDMLEDGFTGPTLGLECAGRIVRVGSAVKNFKVGDRVVTFAASAFSTHVTVPALHAAKLPASLSCEDAATIPVAFLTAYYSLVTLAALKKGEWVLIHGAAGGIGMAAIQIAQSLGAQIIATAGSPAKRDLLRALGVHHVLDSRSIAFVDDVGEITGAGVDVVLNSLAGEAMERSIACLRAFGRFVELGKRDYVSNTHIGLRPFRKNLSYFGVDLDQLISGRPQLGAKIYAEVMAQFRNERFKPLPYSVFEASGVFEAFHLMQHSSHVGKIVVRPPKPGSVRAANKPLAISADGTHIVTGAFGGFGVETIKWLVDRGARHLVLIGRSGAASAEAKAVLRDIAERGVKVIADPCDITDLRALERLFEKIQTTMPRVVGVIHAAMVLDDAIIKNLDADRFTRVLAPKIAGAENLDLVTRGQPLDYFVLFSSVTTMMGNPGQGNYVAANAYMEGLARRRRQEGLPALAIGWGPITDVGVVARDDKLQENLKRLTGVSGMRAREALELMGQAMELPSDAIDLAVMTISPNDGSFRSSRLPVLRSPTYAFLVDRARGLGENDVGAVDLRALVASESIDVVRRKVADIVVAQLAHVLRSREEDISRVRPLGEIGLDSLMALELVMNLEKSFGMDISLAGSSALTVLGIADEIIAHVSVGSSREAAVATTMAEQHAEKVEPAQIETIKGMLNDKGQKSQRLLN